MNYTSFNPTDIFKKDSKGNDIYFFLFNGFIIDNKIKRDKLIDLMGSRYFYLSYKPPMLFVSMIIAFKIVLILHLFYDLSTVRNEEIFGLATFSIYLLFLFIYFLRIVLTLKGCKRISKKEKKWINNNSK